jgi:hypothetical protein
MRSLWLPHLNWRFAIVALLAIFANACSDSPRARASKRTIDFLETIAAGEATIELVEFNAGFEQAFFIDLEYLAFLEYKL